MELWRREEGGEMVTGGGEECELVGEAMAPLVGNGILVGFAGQALISLCLSAWVFFLTTHGNMDIIHPEGTVERVIERKRLDFVSKILMVGSDFQSTLGIAYMVTTFSQAQIMDTYHLHIVFDIVSFVGISNTAALVFWRFCRAKMEESDTKRHSRRVPGRITYLDNRYRSSFIYLLLYIPLFILLCVWLSEWAPNKAPGRCYYSHLVTNASASHPTSDLAYVSITGSWLIIVVLASIFANVGQRRWILLLASLHFPLHLYMTIALRAANQGKFEGETKHENEWDFGQTTAVLLLGIAVVELITKGKEYYDFETKVAKDGLSRHVSERSLSDAEEANINSYLLDTRAKGGHSPEDMHPAIDGHNAS